MLLSVLTCLLGSPSLLESSPLPPRSMTSAVYGVAFWPLQITPLPLLGTHPKSSLLLVLALPLTRFLHMLCSFFTVLWCCKPPSSRSSTTLSSSSCHFFGSSSPNPSKSLSSSSQCWFTPWCMGTGSRSQPGCSELSNHAVGLQLGVPLGVLLLLFFKGGC
jgi:hypothetical protein